MGLEALATGAVSRHTYPLQTRNVFPNLLSQTWKGVTETREKVTHHHRMPLTLFVRTLKLWLPIQYAVFPQDFPKFPQNSPQFRANTQIQILTNAYLLIKTKRFLLHLTWNFMGFNLIYWTPICGKNLLDYLVSEKEQDDSKNTTLTRHLVTRGHHPHSPSGHQGTPPSLLIKCYPYLINRSISKYHNIPSAVPLTPHHIRSHGTNKRMPIYEWLKIKEGETTGNPPKSQEIPYLFLTYFNKKNA